MLAREREPIFHSSDVGSCNVDRANVATGFNFGGCSRAVFWIEKAWRSHASHANSASTILFTPPHPVSSTGPSHRWIAGTVVSHHTAAGCLSTIDRESHPVIKRQQGWLRRALIRPFRPEIAGGSTTSCMTRTHVSARKDPKSSKSILTKCRSSTFRSAVGGCFRVE